MPDLNYHHLYYFWSVAREGGVTRAAQRLGVSEPTISTQVRALEKAIGEQLFARRGRTLVLTDVGQIAARYAEEIFGLGKEFVEAVSSGTAGRSLRFRVGIADGVPKLVAFRLLQPALELAEPMTLVCQDDAPDRLLAALATHAIDLVITDAPVTGLPIRAYNHPLGESDMTIVGAPALVERYRRGFPRSLDGAPFLLPGEASAVRRPLEQWFAERGVRPEMVAHFADSALLKTFGQAGVGLFAVPTVIVRETRKQYGVQVVGRIKDVREQFFAISAERKLKHPAVVAIAESARTRFFS
ncbi:MAG: LysR family transcriptional regulator [Gemmatimonadaceae bacterium]|jgi:LysR family transcriptional activator of nhaA|nr:LysR family transcriptional regulator [Gemmatimonadaceae bacterium]